MTVAVWPSTLPKPSRADYQAQIVDPRLTKSAGSGPPGYRRRWSSVARNVALSINVPRAEKAVFDGFYRDTTAYGALPFWMPDPTTDGWPMLTSDGLPVLTGDGTPVLMSAQWLCLFGSTTPVETIQGVRFNIDFGVVVMP